MTIQEQYLQAKEIKDALRGGYAPGEDLLREVLEQVGLERTLILIHAVAKEEAEYEEMKRVANPDQEEADRLAHERSVGYHG